MPYGFLIPVVLLSVATVAVLVPPGRSRLHRGLSLRAGPVLNEIAQLAFYVLLATTVLSLVNGDIDSVAGWVLVAAAAACLSGLALLFVRGLRTRRVVSQFLQQSGIQRRPRRWPWARIILTPFYRRRRDVEHVADLSYAPGGRRQQLDVYRPRVPGRGAPMLVHFHGGHYATGRKNSQSLPLLYQLAARGWVCISANYRLRPRYGFLDHLSDAKRVIAWAHENGPVHGGDPERLVVSGSSSGAHLAALCAFTPNDPRFQPGFETADTTMAAAITLGGYLDDYDQSLEVPSSPNDYMGPDAPPLLVVHGSDDPAVPIISARDFTKSLRQVSVNPVHLLELPHGQHSFDLFHSPRFEAVIDAIDAFGAAHCQPAD